MAIIEKIFFDRYCKGMNEVEFSRTDIGSAITDLGIEPPKNLGDLIYSYRYRTDASARIAATHPEGMEWTIALCGRGKYKFQLIKVSRIVPKEGLAFIDIPDATPELIRAYALGDEQALLAIVRYNRLIDTFLGLTTYSLQNHLRTTVRNVGQIEIDEIYVGLDKCGNHHIIPVQAKGGKDKIGSVQAILEYSRVQGFRFFWWIKGTFPARRFRLCREILGNRCFRRCDGPKNRGNSCCTRHSLMGGQGAGSHRAASGFWVCALSRARRAAGGSPGR